MQGHVDQVVAPGVQAAQGIVEAEREGAEGAERLVATAMGEQSAPEVIVQDVRPGSVWKEVLVGFDCSAKEGGKRKNKTKSGIKLVFTS